MRHFAAEWEVEQLALEWMAEEESDAFVMEAETALGSRATLADKLRGLHAGSLCPVCRKGELQISALLDKAELGLLRCGECGTEIVQPSRTARW